MMKLRRSTAVLTGTAALLLGGIPAAHGDQADQETTTDALYGDGDPTHDGVWRQAAALLALDVAGQDAPPATVTWLTAQQCEDGSFTAYREDSDAECGADAPADTNATALAVQALDRAADAWDADGAAEAAADGTAWLEQAQNADGGWPYSAGDATDANSTGLVLGALHAVGTDPDGVTADDGATGYDALSELQLRCDGDDDAQAGAVAWQADPESGELFPNEAATVDAALALHGSGLQVAPTEEDGTPAMPACGDLTDDADTDTIANATAAHLISLLETNGQHVPNSLAEGAPDFGVTSRAVLALTAGGYAAPAEGPLTWLEESHTDWEGYDADPAALSQLVLTAHAAGADPTDFGGTDLVAALTALGPEGDTNEAAATDEGAEETASDDDSSNTLLLIIIIISVMAGVFGGVARSKRQRGKGHDGQSTASDATSEGTGSSGNDDGTDSTSERPQH